MPKYDAILIPGGGVRNNGELPIWVQRRLDRALEIYDGEYIIPLSAGTNLKPPPLDAAGFPIFESVAGARYLVNKGMQPHMVLVEASSYDTIGNAYFSKVIHVDPRRFRHLLIITSEFHLPRTESIFRWVYSLGNGPNDYQLQFESVSDAGIDPVALEARIIRERQGLERINDLKSRIAHLEEFHQMLFTKHDAYSATPRFYSLSIEDKSLETY